MSQAYRADGGFEEGGTGEDWDLKTGHVNHTAGCCIVVQYCMLDQYLRITADWTLFLSRMREINKNLMFNLSLNYSNKLLSLQKKVYKAGDKIFLLPM